MLDEKFLDASEMEAPMPFAQALSLLAELQPGETAKYDILIWHKQDTDMISRLFRGDP